MPTIQRYIQKGILSQEQANNLTKMQMTLCENPSFEEFFERISRENRIRFLNLGDRLAKLFPYFLHRKISIQAAESLSESAEQILSRDQVVDFILEKNVSIGKFLNFAANFGDSEVLSLMPYFKNEHISFEEAKDFDAQDIPLLENNSFRKLIFNKKITATQLIELDDTRQDCLMETKIVELFLRNLIDYSRHFDRLTENKVRALTHLNIVDLMLENKMSIDQFSRFSDAHLVALENSGIVDLLGSRIISSDQFSKLENPQLNTLKNPRVQNLFSLGKLSGDTFSSMNPGNRRLLSNELVLDLLESSLLTENQLNSFNSFYCRALKDNEPLLLAMKSNTITPDLLLSLPNTNALEKVIEICNDHGRLRDIRNGQLDHLNREIRWTLQPEQEWENPDTQQSRSSSLILENPNRSDLPERTKPSIDQNGVSIQELNGPPRLGR